MANILHIETATDVCSVAIAKDGQLLGFVEERFSHHNGHSKNLTLFIEACLKKTGLKLKQLSAVAVSRGPGSYSSLRVGTSVAKGICYALDLPLLAVDTLQSLAFASQQAMPLAGALYIPMIDARRMEVYCQVFDDHHHALTKAQSLILGPEALAPYFREAQMLVFCGNGAEKARQVFTQPQAHFAHIQHSARNLVQLAFSKFQNKEFEDLAYFAPFYLKPPNITTPRKKAF